MISDAGSVSFPMIASNLLTNFARSLHLLSEAKGGDEWR